MALETRALSPRRTARLERASAAHAVSPRKIPPLLLALALAVCVVLAGPLVFLSIEAASARDVGALVFRAFTAELLWNTARLTVVAVAACVVLGTGAAFLVERTDLPLRRFFAVAFVVPLAIPDFVVAFGWSSLNGAISGFWGALLVMSVAVYPLVYLPVAASLRNGDPTEEEVARSLGYGALRTFARVTLAQARVAILGGALLCALVILAEYGAFEMLGYQTFTTEIFTELQVAFDLQGAAALSLVLVALSILLVAGELASRGRRTAERTRAPRRPPQRLALGRLRPLAFLGASGLVAGAIGVPVATCGYWMAQSVSAPLAGSSLASATAQTAWYGLAAGALAVALALPVALLSVRHPGVLAVVLERSTYLVLAVPGLVVALALSTASLRYGGGFGYQSAPLMIFAYALLFFPLALVGVRTSLAQAPRRLEEVARSLGVRRFSVFCRVTLPLIAPGLAAGFCLVFLSVVTELTATLVLRPTGVETLSTQFWSYQQNLSYAQAAPFALVMVGLAALPSVALGRYFDRLARRRLTSGPAS